MPKVLLVVEKAMCCEDRRQNEVQGWREAGEPTGKPSFLAFMFVSAVGLEGGVVSAGFLWGPWEQHLRDFTDCEVET